MIHRRKVVIYVLAALLLFAVPFFSGCAGCQKKTDGETVEPAAQPAPAPEVAPMPEAAPEETPAMAPETAPAPEAPAFNVSDVVDVFFAYDKSVLTAQSRDTLEKNADLLKSFPDVSVVIEGHCDERGTNEYNLGLGERRAASAKDFLVSLGIDAGRIDTISYGEEKPFAMGHNESAWKQNRRAHFTMK